MSINYYFIYTLFIIEELDSIEFLNLYRIEVCIFVSFSTIVSLLGISIESDFEFF